MKILSPLEQMRKKRDELLKMSTYAHQEMLDKKRIADDEESRLLSNRYRLRAFLAYYEQSKSLWLLVGECIEAVDSAITREKEINKTIDTIYENEK